MHDQGQLLQVTETGADLGPGLQAALRSFGNALDKLPTVQIRNPTMYSLAHSSEVRGFLQETCRHKHAHHTLPLPTPVPDAPDHNGVHCSYRMRHP